MCREIADAEVEVEFEGVPGCTLTLAGLSEAKDKGNYELTFPANREHGLEVSLWMYPPPVPFSQPVDVDTEGIYLSALFRGFP